MRALSKRGYSFLKATLMVAFVAVYLLSAIRINSFHAYFHHDQHVDHTETDEQDPCHRAIYHSDTNNGCEHNSHLTPYLKCDVCSIISLEDQQPMPEPGIGILHAIGSIYQEALAFHYQFHSPTLSARGPPQS
ncbi:MAG TPA: hypothetical protein VD927_03335 [Chryseosolibacter sp.]|nr:hypothetical protein [Chryseosolibacter sp.]